MKTNPRLRILAALTLAIFSGMTVHAEDLTAFQLAKKGNDYVGIEARDKVVQIRSERSVGSLVPNIWYVVYFDPDATFRATEVKFGAGEKMSVKRPARMIEFTNNDKEPLDKKKLNVDSDKALAIAQKEPLLANLKLTATSMKLERGDDGPTWKVRFWALKLRNTNDIADVGEVWLSSDDGHVTKRDLHPEHVD